MRLTGHMSDYASNYLKQKRLTWKIITVVVEGFVTPIYAARGIQLSQISALEK